MRSTIHFDEVKRTGYKNVKCSKGCGRKLRRQKKFWQTLNPFNKNKDGTVKTREDIHKALDAEVKKWQEQPETCIYCGE